MELHDEHRHAEHSQPALFVGSAVNELATEIKLPSPFPGADLLNPNWKIMGCVTMLALLLLTLSLSGYNTPTKYTNIRQILALDRK